MYYFLRLICLELSTRCSILYYRSFFAKQLYGLGRKFLRTPLYTINNLESAVDYSNNYSKFPNILCPTLTKILVYWVVERCPMVTNKFCVPLGFCCGIRQVSNGLGGLNFFFLNDSPHPVYSISYHF